MHDDDRYAGLGRTQCPEVELDRICAKCCARRWEGAEGVGGSIGIPPLETNPPYRDDAQRANNFQGNWTQPSSFSTLPTIATSPSQPDGTGGGREGSRQEADVGSSKAARRASTADRIKGPSAPLTPSVPAPQSVGSSGQYATELRLRPAYGKPFSSVWRWNSHFYTSYRCICHVRPVTSVDHKWSQSAAQGRTGKHTSYTMFAPSAMRRCDSRKPSGLLITLFEHSRELLPVSPPRHHSPLQPPVAHSCHPTPSTHAPAQRGRWKHSYRMRPLVPGPLAAARQPWRQCLHWA